MSEAERKAIFYWIEHQTPIDLTGTGLKAISAPSGHFTLAVPREDSFDRFLKKLDKFATSAPSKGHLPNEQLATSIQSIREGSPMDRLSDEFRADYNRLVKRTWIVCEVEMITYVAGRKKQREELARTRNDLIRLLGGGTKGNVFETEEIKSTCRAVVRCTGEIFRELVEGQEWRLRICWIEGKPRFETFHSTLQNFSMATLPVPTAPGPGASIVCIVDSGVTSGNPFLEPVSREDLFRSHLRTDPDNVSDVYGHGSGVASLASYYALNISNGAANEGKVWIASARVLDSQNLGEEGRLFSKVLREVVEMFVPFGVRIFNLSVNIINATWNHENRNAFPRGSWVARAIDQLSREYDIVFVVSAGNLGVSSVQAFFASGRSYPKYLFDEDARLLDPAQAALAVTVGAISSSTRIASPLADISPIASQMQPAPFTRCGPGVCREVKPELVEYGGNYIWDAALKSIITNIGTDVITASNKLTPAIAHESGTSLAAPKVAHELALVLEDLRTLGIERPSACLLRAFLVNSADPEAVYVESRPVLDELVAMDSKRIHCVLGYGMANSNRATHCDDYSVIMYFDGRIARNQVGIFDIPVPASLSDARGGKKRITLTLACSPEVQRWGLERYLGTSMKWRLFRGNIPRSQVVDSMIADDAGSGGDQPDRPGEVPGWRYRLHLRSRGTVQHDVVEWTDHQPEYSAGNYTLAIAAYERWGRLKAAETPFAIVVRLEEMSRSVPIYAEVSQKITLELRARSRG